MHTHTHIHVSRATTALSFTTWVTGNIILQGTQAGRHTHTHTHTHTHAHKYVGHRHAHIHTHIHTHSHARTHTHPHTHPHPHTHAHTHVSRQPAGYSCSIWVAEISSCKGNRQIDTHRHIYTHTHTMNREKRAGPIDQCDNLHLKSANGSDRPPAPLRSLPSPSLASHAAGSCPRDARFRAHER